VKLTARVSADRSREALRRPLDEPRGRPDRTRGRRRSAAPGRSGGKRLARTILLGALAAAAALVWIARELDLDEGELLGYAATSLLLVAFLVLSGAVLGGLIWLVRRQRDPR